MGSISPVNHTLSFQAQGPLEEHSSFQTPLSYDETVQGIRYSAKENFLLGMSGYFDGLKESDRVNALRHALKSDNLDLKDAAQHYKEMVATRPVITAIEVYELDERAERYREQGLNVILVEDPNKHKIPDIHSIHIETPLINPNLLQMAIQAKGEEIDLTKVPSHSMDRELTQTATDLRQRIFDNIPKDEAHFIADELSFSLGAGQRPMHDMKSLIQFNYYLDRANDFFEDKVDDIHLKKDLLMFIDDAKDLQYQKQRDIITTSYMLSHTPGMSPLGKNAFLMRGLQAEDILQFQHKYDSNDYSTNILNDRTLIKRIAEQYPLPGSHHTNIDTVFDYFNSESERHSSYVNGEFQVQSVEIEVNQEVVDKVIQYTKQLQQELDEAIYGNP